MDFFIRQGTTKPSLKLRLVDDGKNDKSSFNDLLENSNIYFEMFEYDTNIPIILNANCTLSKRTKKYNQTTDEYFIKFDFNEIQTSTIGRYEGKVTIEFLDTNSQIADKLILPIKEKLYINII